MRLLLSLLLLAVGCAGPTPLLGPPPESPLGPTVAVAATATFDASVDRPRWPVGAEDVPNWQPLRCIDCGERLPRRTGEPLPDCAECDGHSGYQATFKPPFRPALPGDRLRTQVVEGLKQRGSFPDAFGVEGDGEERLEAARAGGAEWLLDLNVRDVKVEFLDTNGWQPVKAVVMIVSSILIFPFVDPPNWWIPSEVYGARAEVDWKLTDLADGATLASGTVDVTAEDAFAAFWPAPSRGFFVAGFLRTPSCLEEEHWADVAEHLRPAMEGGVRDGVIGEVETAGKLTP